MNIDIEKLQILKQLYSDKSKHSNYQKLPSCLERILDEDELPVHSRFEKERFEYITQKIDLGKQVMDIGGNSGFFTFESLYQKNVEHVDYYEGNSSHAKFVELSAELLGLEKKITVFNMYYEFGSSSRKYDTIFLLNVIHHLGVDFEKDINIDEAKRRMAKCINGLSNFCNHLVFQMGFNWGGDINKCLFEKGLKSEMVDFLKEATYGFWRIINIGIPMKKEQRIVYEDINKYNILRNDEYGEFLNRPIFILESML